MKSKEASETIKRNKMNIINLWEEEVRTSIKKAEKTYQAALVNTLPVFLDAIIEALDPDNSLQFPTDESNAAIEHGGERARLTAYTPENIIHEYQILRLNIFRYLKEANLLDEEMREFITCCIEYASMSSCKGFFETVTSLREHFMLTLSHDLRSPLSMAKVGTEFILKDPANATKVKELGLKVEKSLDRIDRMIQSLLDASRLKWGEKLTMNFSECDLIQIVKDVMNENAMTHGNLVKLEAPDIVKGIWDPEGIKRVLENLISNAFKYGSKGTPITIKIEVMFAKAIISVHNEGSYISLEDQKTLFSLFKQLHNRVHARKGWGIGLMLVKGVLEAHGGAVTIQSQPEHGTSFIIDLPLDGEKLSKISSPLKRND